MWPTIIFTRLKRQTRFPVQRAKFSASVVVLAGVPYGGKGTTHLVSDKAKINVDYYTNYLLPKLVKVCNNQASNDHGRRLV